MIDAGSGTSTGLPEVWGEDHSYGVAVKQRLEFLQQLLVSDKEE
jgi:glutathione-regulated potassium-efflux system ancillary protein KefC